MPRCKDGPGTPLAALKAFAKEEGFVITSTCGGKHNEGSAHPLSLAIDVRTRGKTDAEVEAMIHKAKAKGWIVHDERARPPHQKVWSGPHIHIEHPR